MNKYMRMADRLYDLEQQFEQLEQEKCELLGIIQGKDKVIKELEKENTGLKAQLQKKINTTTVSDYPYSALKLEEAKELLNEFMRISKASDEDFEHDYSELIGEAEQFLKEFEIQEDRLCEYCDQYKSCPDGKRCRTCDNGSKWRRSKEE